VSRDELDLGDLDDLELDDIDPPPTDAESRGKPQWADHSCGARWRNRESYGHCCACHLTFTSTAAFDAHRYGPHDGRRACLTESQMADKGLTSRPGHIYEGQPTATLWSLPTAKESRE